jgi:hypothetical protein
LRFKWLPITSFEDMTADLEQLQAFLSNLNGLGAAATTGIGWTGTASTSQVLITVAVTIKNPSGALLRVAGGATAYSNTIGSDGQLFVQVDGDAWNVAARQLTSFYFNRTGQHENIGFGELVTATPFAAGTHTVGLVLNPVFASLFRDTNDWCSLAAYELP